MKLVTLTPISGNYMALIHELTCSFCGVKNFVRSARNIDAMDLVQAISNLQNFTLYLQSDKYTVGDYMLQVCRYFLLSLICTTLTNESAATIVSPLTQLLSNVQAISAR